MYRKAMDTMLPVDEAGSEHLRAQAELKRRRTRARTVEYGSDWDSEEDEDEDDKDDDYGMLVDEDFDSTYGRACRAHLRRRRRHVETHPESEAAPEGAHG